jgi:hypothetical protein
LTEVLVESHIVKLDLNDLQRALRFGVLRFEKQDLVKVSLCLLHLSQMFKAFRSSQQNFDF